MLDTASSSRLQSLPYLLLLISFSVRIYANAAAATASCNNFVSWAKHFPLLCFFFEFFFFFLCFVTAAAFPWFWRSMSESFPWAAAAASQVHVMLLHSCERALVLLLQQSRAFMPLAFWKLDRITIILLDLKVTFRKWVEWVRKRRHKQTTQTNRPLGFSRESDQIWHFHCCFVFSRAINEFQWKRGLLFKEDYHIQTDTQTM